MSVLTRLPAIPAPPHDPTSTLLAGWLGQRAVERRELLGAGLVVAAMLVLSAPLVLKVRRARAAAGSPRPSDS